MGLLRNRKTYDRKQIYAAAEKARAKGRWRRAIPLYRRLLAAEPHDPDLQSRIAPLLAKAGQHFDAWNCYRRAAKHRLKTQQSEEAMHLFREAADALPQQIDTWLWIARLERRRGRIEQARNALLEGRHRMKGRRRRPEAIALLRSALELDPGDPTIPIDLAQLLAATGQLTEARSLFDRQAARSTGTALRRVRAAQWRSEPSLRHSWYWLRSAWAARETSGARLPARSAS